MSDWHLAPLACFDIESTGIDVENDRIVTATLVRINGAQIEPREWLINPGVEIPQAAIDVHGVTNERARAEGIDPVIGCAEILAELDECWTGGRPVVIYNSVFDLTLLDRELRRHCRVSLDGIVGTVIDPFVCDKELDKYRKGSRTLTAACAHYGVKLEGAHSSLGDSLAAARVAYRLAQRYPDKLADLAEINALQATWRAEWAKGFADYLTKQGKPNDVSPAWPMIPYVGAS